MSLSRIFSHFPSGRRHKKREFKRDKTPLTPPFFIRNKVYFLSPLRARHAHLRYTAHLCVHLLCGRRLCISYLFFFLLGLLVGGSPTGKIPRREDYSWARNEQPRRFSKTRGNSSSNGWNEEEWTEEKTWLQNNKFARTRRIFTEHNRRVRVVVVLLLPARLVGSKTRGRLWTSTGRLLVAVIVNWAEGPNNNVWINKIIRRRKRKRE